MIRLHPPKSISSLLLLILCLLLSFILFSPRSLPFSSSISIAIDIPQTTNFSTFPLSSNSLLLTYRTHLELASPLPLITHSPTLGFSKILILSFPTRLERRVRMRKLAAALGNLEIEFVDASNATEGVIGWIGERVWETRRERRKLIARERRVGENEVGGLEIGNDWILPSLDRKGRKPFPDYREHFAKLKGRDEERDRGDTWTETLLQAIRTDSLDKLRPSSSFPLTNLSKALHDPLSIHSPRRQLSPGVISTYLGHLRVVQKIVEMGWEKTLILEDDVDTEWDLERTWKGLEGKLPEDWEMTFLGSCWGHEIRRSPVLHPLLRPSVSPMCLHAYSLSSHGATTLLSHLLSPWSAFSLTIDSYIPSLISFGSLNSFSVEPALVVQRKDFGSDIQGGKGSGWRGFLRDSTIDRIFMDERRKAKEKGKAGEESGVGATRIVGEDEEEEEEVWDGDVILMDEEVWDDELPEGKRDPATRWREVNLCKEEAEAEALRVEQLAASAAEKEDETKVPGGKGKTIGGTGSGGKGKAKGT